MDELGELGMLVKDSEEMGLVGAGLGGGFNNTTELKPMNYKEAMAIQDKDN